MTDILAQKAIDEALRGNWQIARKLNEEILDSEPQNKEALNRLARACLELGKIAKAIALYNKVLKIDPYNTIAQKALLKLRTIKSRGPKDKNNGVEQTLTYTLQAKDESSKESSPKGEDYRSLTLSFIEEPSKTKTVTLIHLGDTVLISNLVAGDCVRLTPHAHRVSIETPEGQYIGRLPDDLSRRLIMLTRGGNQYDCFVRSATLECVKIFIRETKRSSSLHDIPSFPLDKQGYISFTSPDLIHEAKPDASATEGYEKI